MVRVLASYFFGILFAAISAAPAAAGSFEDAEIAYGKQDYATALRLYRALATEGNAVAQYNLGSMYAYGKGAPENRTEALSWFHRAAEQGHLKAKTELGFLYSLDAFRTGDYREAAKWYRQAASQGDAEAQSVLGSYYQNGQGVPQNYAEAAKWYHLAAEQGAYAAQLYLGIMYSKGEGVPRDYVRAYMWVSLAAAKSTYFARNRDLIASRMTAAQIVKAQTLAAEWRPKPANAAQQEITQGAKPEPAATSGTAFFVSKNGEALTNAHVVENCRRISVSGREAKLVARDDANDLALLTTGLHSDKWANWRTSVRQGEDIVVYGFPLTGVLSSSGNVVTGNVAALAGLSDDSRFLQISAPVQPGNSGGPLLDRYGDVVGVVVSKLDALKIASSTGDIPQNVSFAIKASVAAAFLEAQRVVVPSAPPGSTLDPLSTADISTRVQAWTVHIVCVR